ncbi:MAG: glycosyltransferase family 4 protein [Caldilineaceae bacterium]
MNILVISNYYPPHHIGGYGMLCLEVVNGLRERGHCVQVLAGMHGVSEPTVEGHVHRLLTLESDLYYYRPQSAVTYPRVKRNNLSTLRQMVKREQPDTIFIWGMWSLTKEIAKLAEQLLPGRVVYYLANPWPIDPNLHCSYWDTPAKSPLRQLAKQLMRIPARLWLAAEWKPFGLQYEHVLCCSAALRDQMLAANVPLQQMPVVYEGIDLAPYVAQRERRASIQKQFTHAMHGLRNGYHRQETTAATAVLEPKQGPLQMLFVGTLAEHKGVHTTIEALGLLTLEERQQVHLTILGSGHPHYEERLRQLAATAQVQDAVTFHAPIPRAELPDFLGNHDVLLLPSIWEEPLARIMQEGLASGLVVVGAATGGTAEIIRHNENGLLFPASDATQLATQIRRLVASQDLQHRLAEQGQQTAIELFALPRMVDDIENYLVGVHEATLSH